MPTIIKFNDLNTNSDLAKQLADFFNTESTKGIRLWTKNTIYKFSNNEEFIFEHDIYERNRTKNKSGQRYEVVGNNSVGKGGFGVVMPIIGTLALGNTVSFNTHKKRVVKSQNHKDLTRLETEYLLSNQAGHLHIKAPTIVPSTHNDKTSYTTMKMFAGCDLCDLLEKNNFSNLQRIELSKALLQALKEQVINKGIVHRDIKPENIIVDLNSPITVNIIDYGLGMEALNPDNERYGTEGYFAPEIIRNTSKTSAKSDVYSMARVLALIWQVNWDSYNDTKYILDKGKKLLTSLFSNLQGLSDKDKFLIRAALLGMLANEPESRFSIDEAIAIFSAVNHPDNYAKLVSTSSPNHSVLLIFGFFTNQNKVILTSTQANLYKHSCFSIEQIQDIYQSINRLKSEINSFLPYPNKNKKEYEIASLEALLRYSLEYEKPETAFKKIDEDFAELFEDSGCTEVANLFARLLNINDLQFF